MHANVGRQKRRRKPQTYFSVRMYDQRPHIISKWLASDWRLIANEYFSIGYWGLLRRGFMWSILIGFMSQYVEHKIFSRKTVISRSFEWIFILKLPMLGTSNTNATRAFYTTCTIWTDFNKNEAIDSAISSRKFNAKHFGSNETESIKWRNRRNASKITKTEDIKLK